jgi:hypothetical protein
MFFGFTCRYCGAADNEVEVVVESAGDPGSYWNPGEGPEYHVQRASGDTPRTDDLIRCWKCGTLYTPQWFYDNQEEEIVKAIWEKDFPY